MKASFDWDPAKDQENRLKHGIGFAEAQLAFADAHRVIAEDTSHSGKEPRFFCLGAVSEGILTVASPIVLT